MDEKQLLSPFSHGEFELHKCLMEFTKSYAQYGGNMQYLVWQSPKEPDQSNSTTGEHYGSFDVDLTLLQKDSFPITQEQAECSALAVTSAWRTWCYSKENPVIPDDMVLVPIEKLRKITKKMKEVVSARDHLKALYEANKQ